jgi:hypothetical protein
MTLPANIRVNAQLPFPSLVVGSGPITIGKANGIWTVGFSILPFGTIVPPVGDYAVDYFLGYNAATATYFKMSISNLVAALNANLGVARNQRSVTATPIVVAPSDQILNCNINVAAACTLPAAATRAGVPITFKDLGQAGANNITITPSGAEKIDGAASLKLTGNFQYVTLQPFNDGVNSGWALL